MISYILTKSGCSVEWRLLSIDINTIKKTASCLLLVIFPVKVAGLPSSGFVKNKNKHMQVFWSRLGKSLQDGGSSRAELKTIEVCYFGNLSPDPDTELSSLSFYLGYCFNSHVNHFLVPLIPFLSIS